MRLSYYTYVLENYPEKGEHLLFHTRTQGMVKINEELKVLIENYYDPRYFHLKDKDCDELIQLYKMGMIVMDEDEDKAKLDAFFRQLKTSVNKTSFQVTILTTDDCNFNCVYCFEKSTQRNVYMDSWTCDLVINWIIDKMEACGYQELVLTFYGGEPLLNRQGLECIARTLSFWCSKKGILFKFMLQTNGYLMTREVVDRLKNLGMFKAMISVDGVGHVHDRNRPLFGGGGTFDRIMQNIVDCIDAVQISIATGYNQDDIAHIEDLLAYLEGLGILYKLKDFVFAPIHPALGPQDNPRNFRHMSCMSNYKDETIISVNEKIDELMRRKGLPVKNSMAMSACSLTRVNGGVTIDPQGRIFKCNSLLGHPEFAIGDVREKSFNQKHQEFVDLDVWKKCPQNCKFLPICSGGCRFMSFLEYGNFTTPVCKKDYLEEVTPKYIKREYDSIVGNEK